jgi:hypothetical protein
MERRSLPLLQAPRPRPVTGKLTHTEPLYICLFLVRQDALSVLSINVCICDENAKLFLRSTSNSTDILTSILLENL